jgi:hypothetical protein
MLQPELAAMPCSSSFEIVSHSNQGVAMLRYRTLKQCSPGRRPRSRLRRW